MITFGTIYSAQIAGSGHKVSPRPFRSWSPRYIALCRPSFQNINVSAKTVDLGWPIDDTTGSMVYDIHVLDRTATPDYSIDDFASDVALSKPLPAKVVKPNPDFDPPFEANATEFTIRRSCYIIVALDKTPLWRFARTMPNVATAKEGVDFELDMVGIYSDLYHVRSDTGDSVRANKYCKSDFDCRVAYFSAIVTPDQMIRHNFNLRLQYDPTGNGAWMDFPIDPDIKNDGTYPNWPP